MILKTSKEILIENILCNHCLGRQFGKISTSTNERRGKVIRNLLINLYPELSSILNQERSCFLCNNIFDKTDEIIKNISPNFEFNSFHVGTKVPEEIMKKEEILKEKYGLQYQESIKQELNRELGKKIGLNTKKEFKREKEDATIIIHPYEFKTEYIINPLFIYGRYNKFVRGIPQTKWLCRRCKGKGCSKCNQTGKMYEESIQELITELFLNETKGTDSAFHGAGREDIDVLMLGKGRPFVLEIKSPQVRYIDLQKLELEVNKTNKGKIRISELCYVEKDIVEKIKNTPMRKTYLAEIDISLNEDEKEKIEEFFSNRDIYQETPNRVIHRRVDKTRIRKVYKVLTSKENCSSLEIYCDGGLYIKELISGDEARTNPSIAELLGKNIKCVLLNVISIEEKV
ncbi:MAG: tRNA pseudouridine synthase Pus10 [Candidatus Methanofastidiosum methylothiophilum]|jgi:tRNA pseudouridine synthase 10|uniref:tRNA pseudouridine synthase Pus10 n=1 Tax=Candidatus Methanofastidiosum methylothiophilum TaxID=1705564 RepID=A0A150JJQ1_9EURY|nr:MAG: tRNA pseudouridine synthase Pus10 [Candidatus Methanofastidiosum methylthiophilus]MBP6932245.1 tRNA pseudouridine(54/55) synthase Pus10 [Methanofastidiosum sp.]OQC52626.1 MAG: tRNA pseudouridine synthase Pus10 [Euryarchaeota archaeon ADurb.Bin023]KYC57416.1 MAG: tRNA pseudouridine synthase Pus10 [Candidatus Methanofastidiosum methylthiophilus]KYC58202.1 MAG: tRNA pseudouridine synthase Pus10 [Candidatus Methanofastidiosum methylthiophilus]